MVERAAMETMARNMTARTIELLDELDEHGAAAHVRRAEAILRRDRRGDRGDRTVALFLMRMARALLDQAGDEDASQRLQSAIDTAEAGAIDAEARAVA